ncbi:hypothetical protein AAHE18_13G104400 [Arachis hypogaea]
MLWHNNKGSLIIVFMVLGDRIVFTNSNSNSNSKMLTLLDLGLNLLHNHTNSSKRPILLALGCRTTSTTHNSKGPLNRTNLSLLKTNGLGVALRGNLITTPYRRIMNPEVCKRQIAEDFKQERPLWILTCYGHSKGAPCDIVGDISYEELRAAAYEDAKRGMNLQSIVERERNTLNSKLAEFEKLLSEPYRMPFNPSLNSQNHQNANPFSMPMQNNGQHNANPFSITTQNNGPVSVSSFSQLGASLNTGFDRPSAQAPNTPPQSSFFGSGGNTFTPNTANISGRGFSGAPSSPFSTPAVSTMFPNSTSQQPSFGFNDLSSTPMFQTTPDVQSPSMSQGENVSTDLSIWLKEKWNPGEIPEEAPPDSVVR